jgi:class 3 adenylate cyclase
MKYELQENDYCIISNRGITDRLIRKEKWDEFCFDLLELGDLNTKPKNRDVVCSIFDLEGFTSFCQQIDPSIVVPYFIREYLNWFFTSIKKETIAKIEKEGIRTYHELPFFIKFLGDGLLILWDITILGIVGQFNIIKTCDNICVKYRKEFYPEIKKEIQNIPPKIRCGITKGFVFSIGNGSDYLGPCINLASRLQKLPGISVSFSHRGFNTLNENYKDAFNVWECKSVEIRGMNYRELVYIKKEEFEELNSSDRLFFLEP